MHRLLPLLLLLACGAQPAPEFFHAARQDISLNGRQYTVYFTDKRFEVIRLGWASPGQHQQIRAEMLTLVPAVTGCTLTPGSITGDSGEMRGSLRC